MPKVSALKKTLATVMAAILMSSCGGDGTSGGDTASTSQPGTISAQVKVAFGADPNKYDTDGDGLSDDCEISYGYPYLRPDSVDTNSNGVNDADEDTDGDGLSNIQEQQYKTLPLSTDSDDDGLSDKDEILVYKTEPNNKDTDGDGIFDGREIENGSNPLIKDADKIVTSSYSQRIVSSDGLENIVSIKITGVGDLGSKIIVKPLSDAKISGQVSKVHLNKVKLWCRCCFQSHTPQGLVYRLSVCETCN